MGLRFDKRYLKDYGAFDPLDIDYGPAVWPPDEYAPPAGNAINFSFTGSYTPSGTITFDFAAVEGGARTIYPEGWDGAAVGTPSHVLRQEFLLPAGFDTAAVGTAFIDFRIRYLLPTGIDAAWVGEPRLITKFVRDHDFAGAYTAPAGSAVDHDFSSGPPTLYPSGFDTAEFGTASLDIPGAVYPAGFSTTEFGTAVVIQDRFIAPAGFSTTEFGTAQAYNLTQYLLPAGWVSSLVSASAAVINRNRYLRPTGEDYAGVGSAARVANKDKLITPTGFDAAAIGTPMVSFFTRYIAPWGIDLSDFGVDPQVSNQYRWVYPAGLNSLEFGSTFVRDMNPKPFGFDSLVWGDTSVENFIRYVAPEGIDALEGLSGHFIADRIRYLTPAGLNSQVFGTTKVENKNRFLLHNSSASNYAAVPIGAFVSFRIRYITPSGWDSAVVWNDWGGVDPVTGRAAGVYNETQYVLPAGFSTMAFGAPGSQRQALGTPGEWTMRVSFGYRNVVQIGHDSAQFGTTRVGTATSIPVGPATVGDALEHGATRVAHVVSVLGAEYSALGTPSLAHRTTAGAADAAEFGTAQINQRVVAAGDAFTEFGTATLTHSVSGATAGDTQFIGAPRLSHVAKPDSIDAQYIGTPQLNMNIVATGIDALELGTPAIGHKLGPYSWDSLDFSALYVDYDYVDYDYVVEYNHRVEHAP